MPWRHLPNHAQILAVHAAYMGFGEILYFGGDQHDALRNEKHIFDATRLFDCTSNAVTPIASPIFDAFCAGHAFLGASNVVKLLVAGGTEQFKDHAPGLHYSHFPGLKDAAIFSSPDFINPSAGGWDWSKAASMTAGLLASTAQVPHPDPRRTGGRWYPTLTTLPNGDVIAFSGHPASSDGSNSPLAEHNNCIPEIFTRDPQPKGKWRRLASYSNAADRGYYEQHAMTLYPRMHVLPTGDIICTNPVGGRTISFVPDVGPHGGTFYDVARFPPEATAFGGYAASSVLLPLRHDDRAGPWTARAMICGGTTTDAYLLDLAGWIPGGPQRSWRKTKPRAVSKRRVNANTVLLPTGEVLLCGGIDSGPGEDPLDSRGVLMAETYDPYRDRWEVTDAPATVVRNYHSVALLMPDGRVWTAGSDKDAAGGAGPLPVAPANPDARNLDIEIFEPWYVAHSGRPFINAAPSLAYPDETVVLRSTFAREITRVVLMRCGTCTHAFNGDQRMIELEFSYSGGDILLVKMAPNNNILVPGPYLIFTLRTPAGATDAKVKDFGLPSFGTDIYIVQERERRQPGHG